LEYIDGQVDEATFHFKAIVATRQLAKRQMTWMRSLGNDSELDPLKANLLKEGLEAAQALLEC